MAVPSQTAGRVPSSALAEYMEATLRQSIFTTDADKFVRGGLALYLTVWRLNTMDGDMTADRFLCSEAGQRDGPTAADVMWFRPEGDEADVAHGAIDTLEALPPDIINMCPQVSAAVEGLEVTKPHEPYILAAGLWQRTADGWALKRNAEVYYPGEDGCAAALADACTLAARYDAAFERECGGGEESGKRGRA